ncbi:MAG: hypothetical protein NTV62_04120 [Candidatus Gribaldobacteria bacterium]|nr:hypothetical protein [Candidatus Gribaldobacteria bacterium]
MVSNNHKIAKILKNLAEILDIKGIPFKPTAYRRASLTLEKLKSDIQEIYQKDGLKGLKSINGIGDGIAQKMAEYLQKGKISYYEKLKQETAIRQIVTHYFKSKGISLNELKKNAKKNQIVYSRFTKPAKQLLELAGDIEKAKKAIDKVANWAKSRGLDYAIETVFKKWPELKNLKPKPVVKKPFYEGHPMRQKDNRWFVVPEDGGEWLEFADQESKIEWK